MELAHEEKARHVDQGRRICQTTRLLCAVKGWTESHDNHKLREKRAMHEEEDDGRKRACMSRVLPCERIRGKLVPG